MRIGKTRIIRMLGRLAVLAVFLILAARDSRGADWLLVNKGTSDAVILIPSEATETERLAADVLRETIRQMSGGELPIRERKGEAPKGNNVVIGRTPLLPQDIGEKLRHGEKLIFTDPRRDAYIVEVRDHTVYLVGHRDMGTLYAVYDLLESLGCRWFFACPAGEIIPQIPTINVEPCSHYEEPDFAVRWQYTWHGGYRSSTTWHREEAWCHANRLHFAKGCSTLIKGYSGHNFAGIWPAELYDEHPDYFPLLKRKPPIYATTDIPHAPDGGAVLGSTTDDEPDIALAPEPDEEPEEDTPLVRWNPEWGQGSWQPCLSNPGVIAVGLKWAERTLAEHPEYDVVTFAPNDGYGHCQCSNCAAVGNIADNNLNLANGVGKELFEKYPDKMIHIWAYAGGALVPHIKADGYDRNEDRILVNIMSQFSPTPFRDLIEGWGEASHHLCLSRPWYWYHNAWVPAGYPCSYRKAIEEYPFYVSNNVSIIESQIKGDWGKIGFDRYLAARAMWNADLDIDVCARDFAAKMFPSSSDTFYRYLELCWGIKGKSREILYDFMAEACPLFQTIRKKIATPGERERWEFYALFLYAQVLDDNLYAARESRGNLRERYDAHYAIVSFLRGTEDRGIFESSQRIPVIHYPSLSKYGAVLAARRQVADVGSAPDVELLEEETDTGDVLALLDPPAVKAPKEKPKDEDNLAGFDADDRHCTYVEPLVCDSETVDRLFAACCEHFLRSEQ